MANIGTIDILIRTIFEETGLDAAKNSLDNLQKGFEKVQNKFSNLNRSFKQTRNINKWSEMTSDQIDILERLGYSIDMGTGSIRDASGEFKSFSQVVEDLTSITREEAMAMGLTKKQMDQLGTIKSAKNSLDNFQQGFEQVQNKFSNLNRAFKQTRNVNKWSEMTSDQIDILERLGYSIDTGTGAIKDASGEFTSFSQVVEDLTSITREEAMAMELTQKQMKELGISIDNTIKSAKNSLDNFQQGFEQVQDKFSNLNRAFKQTKEIRNWRDMTAEQVDVVEKLGYTWEQSTGQVKDSSGEFVSFSSIVDELTNLSKDQAIALGFTQNQMKELGISIDKTTESSTGLYMAWVSALFTAQKLKQMFGGLNELIKENYFAGELLGMQYELLAAISPELDPLIDKLYVLIDWFYTWPPLAKKFVGWGMILITTIASLAVVFITLMNSLAILIIMFTKATTMGQALTMIGFALKGVFLKVAASFVAAYAQGGILGVVFKVLNKATFGLLGVLKSVAIVIWKSLISAFTWLAGAISTAATAVWSFVVANIAWLGPLALLIGAVVLAIALWDKWTMGYKLLAKEAKNFFWFLVGKTIQKINKLKNKFNEIVNTVKNWVSEKWEAFVDWKNRNWEKVKNAFNNAKEWFKNKVWEPVIKWGQEKWKALGDNFNEVREYADEVFSTTIEWYQTGWQNIADSINSLIPDWKIKINFEAGKMPEWFKSLLRFAGINVPKTAGAGGGGTSGGGGASGGAGGTSGRDTTPTYVEPPTSKIARAYQDAASTTMSAADKINETFTSTAKTFTSTVTTSTNQTESLISKATSFVSNTARSIGSAIGGLLGFQHGGIVPGPIGKPRLAVVHGKETVLPAGQKATTINFSPNVTINVGSSESEMRRVSNVLMDDWKREMRRLV